MGTHAAALADAQRFLRLLFGNKDESAFILIWVKGKRKKESHWFQDVDAAAAFAVEASATEGNDVYVGAGVAGAVPARKCDACTKGHRHCTPSHVRALESEVAAISALWLDVDVIDPAHKKTNLPPTIEDALALVREVGGQPSAIIQSGHGLQAWWAFDQPWAFQSDAEREQAKGFLLRWQLQFKQAAAVHGWDVDSTHDLARVYRIPGTTNYKRQPYQPAILIEFNEEYRLPLERLAEIVPEASEMAASEPQRPPAPVSFPEASGGQQGAAAATAEAQPGPTQAAEYAPGPIMVDGSADAAASKLEALLLIDLKIKRTWEKKRTDLQDTSQSAYDLALGTYAFQFGWTDQEIVNLLISFRRRHSEDLKLREDYYMRTLTRIHRGQQQAAAINQDVTEDKNENLEAVAAAIGLKIKRILKMLTSPPTFVIQMMDDREVSVGEVTGLIDQKLLRRHLANVVGFYLPTFKLAQWDRIAPKLLAACEDVDVGADATDVGGIINWLHEYMRESLRAPHDSRIQHDNALEGSPAFMQGHVCITLDHFRRFIDFRFSERRTNRDLAVLLKRVGCISKVISIRGADTSSNVTSRNMWLLPADQFKPAADTNAPGSGASSEGDQAEAVN